MCDKKKRAARVVFVSMNISISANGEIVPIVLVVYFVQPAHEVFTPLILMS